jgi:hypothetical protein
MVIFKVAFLCSLVATVLAQDALKTDGSDVLDSLLGTDIMADTSLADQSSTASKIGGGARLGRPVSVDTMHQLKLAIRNAQQGDVITVADGLYERDPENGRLISEDIKVDDVTVQAKTVGGVHLKGTVRFRVKANNIKLIGFRFSNDFGRKILDRRKPALDARADRNLIEIREGRGSTVTRCDFFDYQPKSHYIRVDPGTQYATLSYNRFTQARKCLSGTDASDGKGCSSMVQIGPHPTIPGHHHLHHNSWRNTLGDLSTGDYGQEPIRIGLSDRPWIAKVIIEHNYFENTGASDGETISSKAKEVVLRYNTFKNNPRGQLVFRSCGGPSCMNSCLKTGSSATCGVTCAGTACDNVAYSNFFINSGGIRVKEQSGVWILNNYFEADSSAPSNTLSALEFSYQKGKVGRYNGPDYLIQNVNIAHNTFVVNKNRIKLCPDCPSSGPSKSAIVFASNTFQGSPIFDKVPTSGFVKGEVAFSRNFYDGTLVKAGDTLGGAATAGFTEATRGLERNSDGWLSPVSSSSALPSTLDWAAIDTNKGTTGYGALGSVTNKPLSPDDVGPTAE